MKLIRNPFLWAAVLLLTSLQAACAPTFMGKQVNDAFADPQVVALIQAAERGDAAGVEAAIAAGAEIDAPGFKDMTPGHWLLATNQYDALRLLLEHGADPNLPMDEGMTLTHIAAGTRAPEVLDMILVHGGDPEVWDQSTGDTALMVAISQFRFDNADLLLDRGADINAHNRAHQSAANTAIVIGRYDYALKLLQRGYSYNLLDLLATAEVSHVSDDMEPTRQQVIALLKQKIAQGASDAGDPSAEAGDDQE